MKKQILFTLMIPLIVFILSGCDDSSDNDNDDKNSIPAVNAKVYDANNTFLGYSIEIGESSFVLFTESDYRVAVNWDGTLQTAYIDYTESDGNGTAFDEISIDDLTGVYGKMTRYNTLTDTLYTAANVNSDGTAVISRNIDIKSTFCTLSYNPDTYESYYDPHNKNISYTISYGIELKAVSRTEASLPDSISAPFTFDFGNKD